MDQDAARQAKDRRRREDLLAGLRLEARLRDQNPPAPARAEQERRRRYDRIATILRKVDDGSPDVSYIDAQTAQVLRGELARLERAESASAAEAVATPLVAIERTNTILYCRNWLPTVGFYRDDLHLPVVAESHWYVQFGVSAGSTLSVADATKTTIGSAGGQGITLSWRVADIEATRDRLVDGGLEPSDIRTMGSATALYLTDPEGHRVEVWSGSPPGTSRS